MRSPSCRARPCALQVHEAAHIIPAALIDGRVINKGGWYYNPIPSRNRRAEMYRTTLITRAFACRTFLTRALQAQNHADGQDQDQEVEQ